MTSIDTREQRQSGDPPSAKDPRKPFQIDRDRILYSNAFRRLAGVTQVVSPGEGEIFHNRLTHSLKVAQIARRIAEVFCAKYPDEVRGWGGLDPDVCEAAALAHDLGHPPFGHVAEKELQRLVSDALRPKNDGTVNAETIEGYEGNAQSFRIITSQSTRYPDSRFGLDLTRATLNATLKYPWKWKENLDKLSKFGAYRCDDVAFQFARASAQAGDRPFERSLEAQIMDWADDITYSIHDTEDFYRAGLVPLDRLASNPRERSRIRSILRRRLTANGSDQGATTIFDAVFDGLFDGLRINERYEGTREQQQSLYSFVSTKISEYMRETKLFAYPGRGGEALDISAAIKQEVELLKGLTWTYVIENPALAAHQLGQQKAIRVLFEVFDEESKLDHWRIFPAFFRQAGEELREQHGTIPDDLRIRLVADTIATMTDKQALLVYHQFTGVSPSSMLDPVMA